MNAAGPTSARAPRPDSPKISVVQGSYGRGKRAPCAVSQAARYSGR